MPARMRIFLVRHGESTANLDRTATARVADHAIPLSDAGRLQAFEAGRALGAFFDSSRRIGAGLPAHLRVWRSPYRRTRETCEGVLAGLAERRVPGLRHDVKEHPLLVEQRFGLFDGVPDEELPERFPREYAHYRLCEEFEGRFFAPMPMGESRFDVARRVHQTFGTFHRDAERHGIRDLVVVSHGVTLRAFTMMWLGLPYEWFEREPNPGNASIRLIEDGEDRGYLHPGHKPSRADAQERREDGVIEQADHGNEGPRP